MAPLDVAPNRVTAGTWTVSALTAFLFVGIQGLWSTVLVMSFVLSAGEDFGNWSFRWEILRSEWGFDLAYVALAGIAGYALWRLARSGVAHAWWPLVWRTAVLYVPAHFLFTVVLSVVSALIHDRTLYLFGIALIS